MNLFGRGIRKALGLLAICTFVWIALSCQKEERLKVPAKAPAALPTDVVVDLAVSLPDEGVRTRSGHLLDRTEGESGVKSLVVFIVDLTPDGKEVYPVSASASLSHTAIQAWLGGNVEGVEVKMNTTTGKKHIYVGANMSEAHIRAFAEGKPFKASGVGNAINEVMSFDTSDPDAAAGREILMFAPAMNGTDRVFEITSADRHVSGTAGLERMVAKVLLTANLNTEITGKKYSSAYANVSINDDANKGWCRVEDIRYMVRNINRTVNWPLEANIYDKNLLYGSGAPYLDNVGRWYPNRTGLVGTDDPYEFYMDPNFLLSEQLDADGEVRAEAISQFENNPFDALRTAADNVIVRSADVFDESRLSASTVPEKDSHYSQGLYCLENTVIDDIAFSYGGGVADAGFWDAVNSLDAKAAKDQSAGYVTSYLQIAMRCTPGVLHTENGEETFTSEDAALQQLTGQVDPGNSSHIYDEGTFWARYDDGNSEWKFYTLKGMQKEMTASGLSSQDFVIYEGGWSYYTTFIDGKDDGKHLTYDGQREWGVRRNHYYILNIEKITFPGSSVPATMPIKINSVSTEWRLRGLSEITIKPNY